MSLPLVSVMWFRIKPLKCFTGMIQVSTCTCSAEKMASGKGNVAKSGVWEFFKVSEDKTTTTCTLCKVKLTFKGGSTSAMRNHLKAVHKSLGSSPTPYSTMRVSPTGGRQADISQMFTPKSKKTMSASRQEELIKSLAYMCAVDLRPMSIVSGKGFISFCNKLNPDFKVPCRTTLTKHIGLLYVDLKAAVTQQTKNNDVAITTDMWTSSAGQRGYITVTGHYIDQSWKMQCKVLATRPLDDRHTGVNIAKSLDTIKAEFLIKDFVAVTTDNAANMQVAAREAGIQRIPCFSHTLQLAICDSLKKEQISKALLSCRKLVSLPSCQVIHVEM